MIIQCEKCQTRFRLDDSRVTDKGVKVRCTKCKHVFRVQKKQTDVESTESETAAADFSSPAAPAEPAVTLGEVDVSSFECAGSNSEPDVTPLSPAALDDFTGGEIESAPDAPRQESPQGLDFFEDTMFGAVVPSAPDVPGDPISFDFDDDSFSESMDMTGQDSSSKSGTLFSLDTHGDAPFNLGDIDFGDELTSVAVQQVNPEDLKPSREMLFAPLAEAEDTSAPDADDVRHTFPGADSADYQQELPPLPISSRRRQSPLFGALIGGIALIVITALVYFGISSFSAPRDIAATENGTIVIRAIKAAYIENANAGELLVISGEAFNKYSQPRAALQVKVTVFDASGRSIATKSAYCGNPLTEEQLKSLAIGKIEAVMVNQFGDSLANIGVAPGKSIPFVVVIANLPKGASNFAVQSAGSTVATGRQQ